MLKFAADENFNNDILRGVRRRNGAIDIVRVQDEGLSGAIDPVVLEWAAGAGRMVLTHDVNTMTAYVYDRVRVGQPMPGVVEASRELPIGKAIEDILLLVECSQEGEWEGQIIYLPLRSRPEKN
jgi:hypothetical protein